jgi:hypothetical protein
MTLLPFVALLTGWPAPGGIGLWGPEAVLLALLIWLNRGFLGFVTRRKGAWFGLRSLAMMFLQHLYSGVGLLIGAFSFALDRIRGR